MNIITEHLLVSKVIKVKDKVDKILKRYSIIDVIAKYTKKYMGGVEKIEEDDKKGHSILEKSFLSINKHSKMLKSPFMIYDKSKSALKNIPNMQGFFIPMAQAIESKRTLEGLNRDNRIKLGKFLNVKKIILFVDFELDEDYIEEWLEDISNNLIPLIQHEWVHVEQLLKSRKLDKTNAVDMSNPDFSIKDLKNLSKHQKAVMSSQDNKYLKKILSENIKVFKDQIASGIMTEKDLIEFSESKTIKEALTLAATQAVGMQEYHSRKSEVGAYAVQAAEMFVRGETDLVVEVLATYVAMSIDSPKIKKKFFRLYSEALQERGVPNKMISDHVNTTYTNVKKIIIETKKQAEEFMNSLEKGD